MIPSNSVNGWITVDERRCKGCNLCVSACPRGVLAPGEVGSRGYPVVRMAKPEACTGCALCAIMCPDVAITVYRSRRGRQCLESVS